MHDVCTLYLEVLEQQELEAVELRVVEREEVRARELEVLGDPPVQVQGALNVSI